MGARTLKPGYADRYISVRRSLIYLRKSLSDMTQFAVFEPNDFRLWRRVTTTIESFLTDFWNQGGLRGETPADSFFVKCDAENNPLVSIENGQVNIEVGVALQRPAEFVVIRISQYDSGAVVTIA
jgi:phage tail sheath protein FI